MYAKVNESNEVEKKDLISHHDFHKAIALAWINPAKYRAKCTTPVATASSITMDSSLRGESKRARRRSIRLDSSYNHLP